MWTRFNRTLGLGLAPFLLIACSNSGTEAPAPEQTVADIQADEKLSPLWRVIEHPRREEASARDDFRNPADTLNFFELQSGLTVAEVWPGGGWYTDILAPYAVETGGQYHAIIYDESLGEGAVNANTRFKDAHTDVEAYGTMTYGQLGPNTDGVADPGSLDRIYTFRNTHSWMGRGIAEKAFEDFYTALKPGGILGLVQHRLPETETQDPMAGTGYVMQDYVIAMAEEAGFELVATSEINANPADTADHPFGVWTLPPVGRTAPRGEEPSADFDAAKYQAIGESDRMTLKFRKPQ